MRTATSPPGFRRLPRRTRSLTSRISASPCSVEQREAILLVGAEGFTYEEAARICRTRVGTIKSRVNRARTRLSELLGYEDVKDIGPDGLVRAALVSP
jgi:RNA polymerase sigma-70 factor, ECF subfamily